MGGTGNLPSHSSCAALVRSIQDYHQNIPSQSDIEYSLLACIHGYVYEGRINGYKTGANGNSTSNSTEPSICSLTNYDSQITDDLKRAINDARGSITNLYGYGLRKEGHRDNYGTQCPGNSLYAWVCEGMPDPDGTPDYTGEDEMAEELVYVKGQGQDAVYGYSETFGWKRHIPNGEALLQEHLTGKFWESIHEVDPDWLNQLPNK